MSDQPPWVSPGAPPPSEPPSGEPPGWGRQWAPGQAPGWGQPWGRPPDPQPGIIPLRPIGLGEILDGAFTCIRQYPRATLGLSAVVVAVTQAIQLPFSYLLLRDAADINTTQIEDGTPSDTELARFIGDTAGVALIDLVIGGLGVLILTGMLTAVIGNGVLGRPAPIGATWQTIRPQIPRLVGVALLTGLIVAGVLVAALLPGIGLALAGAGAGAIVLLVLGGIAGVCLAVYFYVSLALATPALVLERQRVVAALRRSRLLVRGAWWRIFGILLLATVIGQIISGIISFPFTIAGAGGGLFDTEPDAPTLFGLLMSAVGGVVAGTIVRPFLAGVGALLYVDRRIRREALDVALLAAANESEPAAG